MIPAIIACKINRGTNGYERTSSIAEQMPITDDSERERQADTNSTASACRRALQKMRSYCAPAIAIAMIMPPILSARSDDIPTLDVNPVCRGIAMQGELEVGLQQTGFDRCVQSEQAVRSDLKKEWSTFSTADKSHGVALAKTGGESSYAELIAVWKWRAMSESCTKLITRPRPSQWGFRRPRTIASRLLADFGDHFAA